MSQSQKHNTMNFNPLKLYHEMRITMHILSTGRTAKKRLKGIISKVHNEALEQCQICGGKQGKITNWIGCDDVGGGTIATASVPPTLETI